MHTRQDKDGKQRLAWHFRISSIWSVNRSDNEV